MLLRIGADADAETFPAFHPADGADQFVGMGIPARGGGETLFSRQGVPAQGHDIVDAQVLEVLDEPFDF